MSATALPSQNPLKMPIERDPVTGAVSLIFPEGRVRTWTEEELVHLAVAVLTNPEPSDMQVELARRLVGDDRWRDAEEIVQAVLEEAARLAITEEAVA